MALSGHRLDAIAYLEACRSQHERQVREKNSYGRQLARVHAPQYQETLLSRIYPGKMDSGPAYIPILEEINSSLGFTAEQKAKTLLRSDAGFGSDANTNRALEAGWQVLAKGKGGRRPQAYARRIADKAWQDLGNNRWVASAPTPPVYVRPTTYVVLRWLTATGELKFSTVACSVTEWSVSELIGHYDDRGACETEIQADKVGLRMERRRKKHLAAQEALVLLTDLAHNLLAWTPVWMALPAPLTSFGTLRLVEDVLCLPGRLIFSQDRLVEVQLSELHPHAEAVADGLQHLLTHFGNP